MMSVDSVDAYGLVKRFQQLQEERVHAYHMFNEGHKIYLGSAPQYDFIRFRQLVHDLTKDFKRISDDVISIEKLLKTECERENLAKCIRNIQDAEKIKLGLTAKLQMAKQGAADNTEEFEREIEIVNLKHELNSVIEKINEHLEELRYEAAEL